MQRQMMATAVTLGQIQQQLATVADNIANVGTTGFKGRDASFSDLLFQNIRNVDPAADETDQAGRLTPSGIRAGSGAKIGDTRLDLTPGAIRQTGNPLDLALTDDHQFFTIGIAGPGGQRVTAYTRAGSFNAQPDPQNANQLRLLTKNGDPVLAQNGQPIMLPAGYRDLEIDGAGVITAVMANGARIASGQLGRVTVSRPQLLENQGNSLFTLPDLAPLGVGLGQVLQPVAANDRSVRQGELENANVDLADEMTELINLQRNYQLNARSLTLGDQMAGLVNGLVRG